MSTPSGSPDIKGSGYALALAGRHRAAPLALCGDSVPVWCYLFSCQRTVSQYAFTIRTFKGRFGAYVFINSKACNQIVIFKSKRLLWPQLIKKILDFFLGGDDASLDYLMIDVF